MLAKCHWDWVKDEALWMARDFREERKWRSVVGWRIGQELEERFQSERPLKRRKLDPESILGDDAMRDDEPSDTRLRNAVSSSTAPGVSNVKAVFGELDADPESEIVEILELDDGVEAELDDFEANKANDRAETETAIKEEEVPMEIDSQPPSPSSTPDPPLLSKEEVDAEMKDAQEVEEFTLTIPELPPEALSNDTEHISKEPLKDSPQEASNDQERTSEVPDGLKVGSLNPVLGMPATSQTVEDPRQRPAPVRQNSLNSVMDLDPTEKWRGRKAVLTASEGGFSL